MDCLFNKFKKSHIFFSPIPTYRWTRVDRLPLPAGRHKLLSFGRILRIDAAELTDSGRYRCTVQNELGTSSAELRVVIQGYIVN
jgi:hypothetical protein